jgi:hypothetical protein
MLNKKGDKEDKNKINIFWHIEGYVGYYGLV